MTPYFLRIFLPNFDFANPENIHKFLPDVSIRFAPEHTETSIEYGPENTLCHYYCVSCYAAGGYKEACFKTQSRAAKYMKNGPTREQQQEMQEHGEQHSIIYQWAKGLLK